MLLAHTSALSASQFVHKKKSVRIYTSMYSGGLELTHLTHSRHEDNLPHRDDRVLKSNVVQRVNMFEGSCILYKWAKMLGGRFNT